MSTSRLSAITEADPHIALLDATHQSVKIMFATNHSEDQMQFDRFLPSFQLIIDRAEVFISSCAAPSFSINIAIIPVLYFVALRCRDPFIRRKAVALLGNTARREGVWDAQASTRIAREIIAIEEESLSRMYGLMEIWALYGESEWSSERVIRW